MQYLISFLEGIITFISPCLLPMLPIYITYFAGGGERTTTKTLRNAFGFVLGFTVVFVALGALAGTLGSFLTRYQTWVNLIGGGIVILFGLNYMGLLHLNFFKGSGSSMQQDDMGFWQAFVFGVVFSVGNDVEEDMVPASALGAKVFLLTDCLINKKERDINAYPHGGFAELKEFLKENI